MDGVESITQESLTRTHWVVKVAGATREFDTEITDQVPVRSSRGAAPAVTPAGTPAGSPSSRWERPAREWTIELGWEPAGLAEKAGAAFNIDQRQVDKSAEDFKSFIESRGAETGAWR